MRELWVQKWRRFVCRVRGHDWILERHDPHDEDIALFRVGCKRERVWVRSVWIPNVHLAHARWPELMVKVEQRKMMRQAGVPDKIIWKLTPWRGEFARDSDRHP